MIYLWSFLCGGAICAAAQILLDKTKLTPARILVGAVVTGAFFSAIGVYGVFKDFAGAGASVPLTGFGHLLVEGVREEVDGKGLLGALTGGLSASSAGISAALVFAFLSALVFKSRPK